MADSFSFERWYVGAPYGRGERGHLVSTHATLAEAQAAIEAAGDLARLDHRLRVRVGFLLYETDQAGNATWPVGEPDDAAPSGELIWSNLPAHTRPVLLTLGMIDASTGKQLVGVWDDDAAARRNDDNGAVATIDAASLAPEQRAAAEHNSAVLAAEPNPQPVAQTAPSSVPAGTRARYQLKYSDGFEVLVTGDRCTVRDRNHRVRFEGHHDAAMAWLAARGIEPLG